MRALQTDERGAIMVMALFMAVFVGGCLAYLVGLGEAIAQREQMQGAADAAAFSSAVVHARGMNLIALTNMTMAALLAILVALKLLEMVAYACIAIATALAFVTSGGSLVAVPPLKLFANKVNTAHRVAEPKVHATLRVLNAAARGIRVVVPWAAQAKTLGTIAASYSPPVEVAFAVSTRITLPTRQGSFDDLCDKAGEYVADVASTAAAPLGLGPVRSVFNGAITAVTSAGSAWFCGGDPSAKRPSFSNSRTIEHPILPSSRKCGERALDAPGEDAADLEDLCAQAKRDEAAAVAAVSKTSGECVPQPGYPCGIDSVYELRASMAQTECAPDEARRRALSGYSWQAREFTRIYQYRDDRWHVLVEREEGSEYLRRKMTHYPPCGDAPGSVGTDWGRERWRGEDLVPLCDDVVPTEQLSHPRPASSSRKRLDDEPEILRVQYTEVLQVFGCSERTQDEHELDGEAGALEPKSDSSSMAPQLLAKDAVLGGEAFAIRAVAVGKVAADQPAPVLDRFISAEAEDNARTAETWVAARQLGRLAFAQAEYFFATQSPNHDPEDYLWDMRWQARLRHFRVPTAQPSAPAADDLSDGGTFGVSVPSLDLDSACRAAAPENDICNALDSSRLEDLIMH